MIKIELNVCVDGPYVDKIIKNRSFSGRKKFSFARRSIREFDNILVDVIINFNYFQKMNLFTLISQ
jgi:hypothetical protein